MRRMTLREAVETLGVEGEVVFQGRIGRGLKPTDRAAAPYFVIIRVTDPVALVEASANTQWRYKEHEPGLSRRMRREENIEWDPQSDELLCSGHKWAGDLDPYNNAVRDLENNDGHMYVWLLSHGGKPLRKYLMTDNNFNTLYGVEGMYLNPQKGSKKFLLGVALQIPDLSEEARNNLRAQLGM